MNNYKWLTILTGGILFCIAAFYNEYPLVTSDTGAYIGNLWGPITPKDRPITYSVFIFLSSFHISAWLVVFIQSFWLSYLLYKFFSLFFHPKQLNRVSLFLMAILTFFTSLSWYSSQIMPDIFTAMLFLSAYIYLMNHEQTKFSKIFILFTFFSSCLMHNSNILTGVTFSLLIYLLFYIFNLSIHRGRIHTLIGWSVGSGILLATIHLIGGHGFTLSRSSHVFLMGKMAENGVLERYLNSECPTKELSLCEYKEELPAHAWDFIWAADGPFQKTGGWEGSRNEYNSILFDILSSPRFLSLYIMKSIQETFIQFFNYEIGDGLTPNLEPSNAFWQVQKAYHTELRDYEDSLQNKGQLEFGFFNKLYLITLFISTALFLFLWNHSKRNSNPTLRHLIYFVVLFLVINACITASLANVLPRLQSRVIWLIPLSQWIYIIKELRFRIGKG